MVTRWVGANRWLRRPWVSGPIGAVLALIILGVLVAEGDDDPSPPPGESVQEPVASPDAPGSDTDSSTGRDLASDLPTRDAGTSPAPGPAAEPDRAPTTDARREPDAAPEPQPAPPAHTAEGDLEVHFIDAGQADATLLLHDEVAILVDAGHWQRSDVVPYLRAQGVDRLDLVVVTHPHADHIGQFDQVMGAFAVDEVWWSGATATSATFGRALDALESSSAAYEEPRAGDRTTIGPLQIDILTPAPGASLSDLNDASLGMRVTYGEVAFVFTGDAERDAERRMVADQAGRLPADVLHLGHHGSNTSSTASFLTAVDPAVAIYSAGADNPYGHPHREVIARVEQAGIAWYGTDTHGDIVVTTDGDTFSITSGTTTRNSGPDTSSTEPVRGAGGRPPPRPDRGTDRDAEADPPVADDPPTVDGSSCGPGQVDINTADVDALEQIVHIGPVRAAEVIALRPFPNVEALRRVGGIADGRLRDIRGQGVACAS